MKIAVTGKGGVGKTTLAAVLARLYAEEGRRVLCADADPDANLGQALGFSEGETAALTPISQMSDLIAERTGAQKGGYGAFFKINPRVDDIPDRFAIEKNGVKLLVMGTVDTGGSGCVCPENVVLKRVISNLVLGRGEVVILDMEAGLEHLGRGTADFVDFFLVVVEPGARSVQTYRKVRSLAADIGVRRVSVVANKVRSKEDEDYLRERIPGDEFLGSVRYSPDVIEADRSASSPYDTASAAVEDIKAIKKVIDGREQNGARP
ncbi:MAG: AAA family ATPase [Oscillospiraceae bacterium]|jgi:CO dehydrogenase maturation factor|nr:AAA family ATPase [Oscillospiraceae bacterium]